MTVDSLFLFWVDVPAFSGVGPNQVIDVTDQGFIKKKKFAKYRRRWYGARR